MSTLIALPGAGGCQSSFAWVGIYARENTSCNPNPDGSYISPMIDWLESGDTRAHTLTYSPGTTALADFDCAGTTPTSVTANPGLNPASPPGTVGLPASGLGGVCCEELPGNIATFFGATPDSIAAMSLALFTQNTNTPLYAVYKYWNDTGSFTGCPYTGACLMNTIGPCPYYYLPPPMPGLPAFNSGGDDFENPTYLIFVANDSSPFSTAMQTQGWGSWADYLTWCASVGPDYCDPASLTPSPCMTTGDPFFGDEPP